MSFVKDSITQHITEEEDVDLGADYFESNHVVLKYSKDY